MKILFSFSFLILLVIKSNGQETKYLTDYPGKWIYSNENLSQEWYAESFYKMNSTELAEYHSTTNKLISFFQKQPIAQNPKGINLTVKSRAMYNQFDHARFPVLITERVKAKIFIQFCPIIEREGRIISFCDEVSYVDIVTNYPSASYETGMNIDPLNNKAVCDKMLEMFYRPDTLMNLGNGVILYNWYYENRLVIARKNQPYWIPVTTKEFIDRNMAYYNAALKEKGQEFQMVVDALKKEIALVPASQMNKAVYVSNSIEDRPLLGICSIEESGGKAVYMFNPSYFDPSLSRSKVQLITISIPGNLDDISMETESDRIKVLEFITALKGKELVNLLDAQ